MRRGDVDRNRTAVDQPASDFIERSGQTAFLEQR